MVFIGYFVALPQSQFIRVTIVVSLCMYCGKLVINSSFEFIFSIIAYRNQLAGEGNRDKS